MRTLIVALGVALISGCGGGSETPADRLTGFWALQVNTNCGYALTFADGTKFERDISCILTNGTVGLEAVAGAYVADGDQLTTTAALSSCPNETKVIVSTYTIAGDELSVSDPGGVVVLVRMPKPSGGVAATYGCYDQAGAFTPNPVAPVP